MELQPSSTFAGYRIDQLVGRGGMGAVYSATRLSSGRRVALKLVTSDLASDDLFRDRFKRESRLLGELEHPHIVGLEEAGEADGALFMATQFVTGTDLGAVIAQWGPVHPAHAANVVAQVASALDAAATLGLVHRDVKPANVLLEPRGDEAHAYLTDFGLSKQVGSQSGLTATGQWVGTVDYAAPEQLQAQPVDARTDVYALGCVLYEALTGSIPFPLPRQVDQVLAHIASPVPRPSAAGPQVPPELDAVIARAMNKRAEERFASAGALAAAASAAVERAGPGPPVTWFTAPERSREIAMDRDAPTVG